MASVQSSAEVFVSAVRLDTSLTLAAFSLLYYDYALTVVSEINYFWSHPSLSSSSVLFALNRYFGLFGPIPVFFEYFGVFSEDRCRQLQVYHQIYTVLSQGVVAVLMTLRTYALYNCNKRMLVVLIILYIGGGVQSLTASFTGKSPLESDIQLDFSYPRCNLSLTNDQGIHLALGWGAMLWYDTIIFALTLFKAIQVRHEITGGLLATMFRDGTIYCGILVAANMVNIITFLRSSGPLKGTTAALTNVLSVTLTSRLMLNLRDPRAQTRRLGPQTTRFEGQWTTTAQFTSRMMSFRARTVPGDDLTTFEMGESSGSTNSESVGVPVPV